MIPNILAAYGLKKSAGAYFFTKVTDAAGDHWITVHPNGPGTKGQPVLLSKGGEIKGGMGGKFNGMHISSAHGKQSSAEELLKANQAFSGSVKRLQSGGIYEAEIKRIRSVGASIYGRTPEASATRERYRKVLAWATEGQEKAKSKPAEYKAATSPGIHSEIAGMTNGEVETKLQEVVGRYVSGNPTSEKEFAYWRPEARARYENHTKSLLSYYEGNRKHKEAAPDISEMEKHENARLEAVKQRERETTSTTYERSKKQREKKLAEYLKNQYQQLNLF